MSELRGFKELQIARDSLMKAGNKSPSLRQQSAYVTSNKKQITKKVSETVYQGGSIILQEAARQTGSSYFPKPKVTSKLPPVSGVNATGLDNKSNEELMHDYQSSRDPQEKAGILFELNNRAGDWWKGMKDFWGGFMGMMPKFNPFFPASHGLEQAFGVNLPMGYSKEQLDYLNKLQPSLLPKLPDINLPDMPDISSGININLPGAENFQDNVKAVGNTALIIGAAVVAIMLLKN